MLLQIFLDAFGLAHQKRNVLIADFEKMFDDVQRLLELLSEFIMLLIAPGIG